MAKLNVKLIKSTIGCKKDQIATVEAVSYTHLARQGSIRAPQWTGGGVALGPKPRDYRYRLNKKVRRLALKSALSAKYEAYEIYVIERCV